MLLFDNLALDESQDNRNVWSGTPY